ncbi:hypothetical protein C2S52_005510 [Perilla frutescens var. hirtella]|nr:hypothetical protein C2S51_010180 [Perilla frutescens var. frutescens]KAH6795033.1 hypothetical protein C2S52_005510 [Perilla frutescens var. hirtella]
MMENDDHQHEKQELRQYCKVTNNRGLGQMRPPHDSADHDHHGDDHQGLRMMKPHEGNKHSYFLRAKTPRFPGFQAADHEDGEFKKPSSISTRVGMDKERVSSFMPSPFQSSRSKANHFDEYTSLSEEEDLANCLVMLSNKSHPISRDDKEENKMKEVVEKGMFQCKACKKVFNSHQALGGHRASHKKVKGCFASKIEGLQDEENIDEESIQEDQEPLPPPETDAARPNPSASTRKRAKMHECSVCRRVFSSGQALGGHKRCHWLTTSTDNAFIPNFHDFQYDHRSQQLCKKPIFTKPHLQYDLDHQHQHNPHNDHDHQLDLNLNLPPAPKHDQNRVDDDKTSKCEASTRLCLQQWTDQNQQKIDNDRNGEDACGMKLRKLSDLRDVNLDGGWLQMGIPSTNEMR